MIETRLIGFRPARESDNPAAMIASVMAAHDVGQRIEALPDNYPNHHTVTQLNRFGLEWHELEEFRHICKSKRINATEAAAIIIRSRKTRA